MRFLYCFVFLFSVPPLTDMWLSACSLPELKAGVLAASMGHIRVLHRTWRPGYGDGEWWGDWG